MTPSKSNIYPLACVTDKIIVSTVEEIFKISKKELNKDPKSLMVIDIGSGRGQHPLELAKKVKLVVGVEPDEASFKVAQQIKKETKSKAVFYNELIENFSTSLRFDVAISLNAIEHMPNAFKSFKRIFELLNPGGIIYMTAPNKLWPIEPHYNLPFLSYLPLPLANLYMKITGKGESYKESSYSKSYFGMKRFLNEFPCTFYFYLPDPNSPYLGGTGMFYKILYNVGIFIISHISLFWLFSKGFIIIVKKNR